MNSTDVCQRRTWQHCITQNSGIRSLEIRCFATDKDSNSQLKADRAREHVKDLSDDHRAKKRARALDKVSPHHSQAFTTFTILINTRTSFSPSYTLLPRNGKPNLTCSVLTLPKTLRNLQVLHPPHTQNRTISVTVASISGVSMVPQLCGKAQNSCSSPTNQFHEHLVDNYMWHW